MIAAAAVMCSALALAPQEVGAPGKSLERMVEECSKHISDRFVFFLGGSGVLISADGYCLTNHHVAGTQDKTTVQLHGGERYPARLVCTDALGDVSLFKIEPENDRKFPYVEFGDSDRVEMGQYVLACGNPFGIAMPDQDKRIYPTITLGIASATHRNQQTYFDCIQTDASVNPGNSGGPLVTLDGKLVGINGRIATRYMNRVNSGVGYAIPTNQIKNFLPGMIQGGEKGKIHHGMVDGLELSNRSTQGEGALVQGVQGGSSALKAGFRAGDVIVRVNQYSIFNAERFSGAIGTYPEGSEITIRVKRTGETKDLKVVLARLGQIKQPIARKKGSGYLGAYVEVEKGELTVKDVRPGSPADLAGMLEGDVILSVGGKPVSDRTELLEAIWIRKPGSVLSLKIRRDGQEYEMKTTLGSHPDDQ